MGVLVTYGQLIASDTIAHSVLVNSSLVIVHIVMTTSELRIVHLCSPAGSYSGMIP